MANPTITPPPPKKKQKQNDNNLLTFKTTSTNSAIYPQIKLCPAYSTSAFYKIIAFL